MADERPQRPCDHCDVVDDHPRHVVNDANAQIHHMDCGAAAGCETCIVTEAAYGEKRGDELVALVTGPEAEKLRSLEEDLTAWVEATNG